MKRIRRRRRGATAHSFSNDYRLSHGSELDRGNPVGLLHRGELGANCIGFQVGDHFGKPEQYGQQ